MNEIVRKEALEATAAERAAIKGLKEICRLMDRQYTIMEHVRKLLDLPVSASNDFIDSCSTAASMVEQFMGRALFEIAQKEIVACPPEEDTELPSGSPGL